MQSRMKKHPLTEQQVTNLLNKEFVGRLATVGSDGYPYITPVHYVFMDGAVFVHGLAAGEKLGNINANAHVGFEVETMQSLIHDAELPCDTNTQYESVIIRGNASIVADPAVKKAVLDAVVAKYTPQHTGKAFPENMLKMTAVIKISVEHCTGKFYSAG